MPQYKFGANDIFHNVIKTYPKYVFSYYHNTSYINNRNTQGQNVVSGSVYLQEICVDRPEDQLITAVIHKGGNNKFIFANVTSSYQYKNIQAGNTASMVYPISSSAPVRRLIIAEKISKGRIGVEIRDGVTDRETVREAIALKNTYDHYKTMSKYYDFDKYIMVSGGVPPSLKSPNVGKNLNLYDPDPAASFTTTELKLMTQSIPQNDFTNIISIPSIFYGSQIKKGSVDLKFYFTGSLIGRAQDTRKNGELIETTGSSVNTVVGMVLYNEGIIVLTASHDLNSSTDGYLSPVTGTITTKAGPTKVALQSAWRETPSWAQFMAHESFITSSTDPDSASYGPISSSYILEYQGVNKVPTITMMAHAPKNDLNWSNNPTYIEKSHLTTTYTGSFVLFTGSKDYAERDNIPIKNTISSSHCGFTASYQPQTFISKVGIYDENEELIAIAKMATPVRKINERDYTFKLKLDL